MQFQTGIEPATLLLHLFSIILSLEETLVGLFNAKSSHAKEVYSSKVPIVARNLGLLHFASFLSSTKEISSYPRMLYDVTTTRLEPFITLRL